MVRTAPKLETSRLLLRGFGPEDLDAYAERIFGDAQVMRFLPQGEADARGRARRTMNAFVEHWQLYPYGPWAVVDKAQGELLGHCGLRFVPEINEVELLYAFARP